MAHFDIANLALQSVLPNNAIINDAAGLPSAMVFIPAFKNSDVLEGGDDNLHPAFIVNGQEIKGFWYSKYENVVHNGAAYSLPMQKPATASHFNAISYCKAKGPGWHLSTNAEWAAIALWCKKNGFLPYGNNDDGKDSRESNYKAIPATKISGVTAKTLTGTGPLTWTHDGTAAGICDMNGNDGEWQGGARFVGSELQILADNDAAAPSNSQILTSSRWKAINAADGSLVEPENVPGGTYSTSGATLRLEEWTDGWAYATSTTLKSSTLSHPFYATQWDTGAGISDAAINTLCNLALVPALGTGSIHGAADTYDGDAMRANNGASDAQYIHRSGGSGWLEEAGVFAIGMREWTAPQAFRCAYIPELAE